MTPNKRALAKYLEDAQGTDIVKALAAVAALEAWITEREAVLVPTARRLGLKWEEIASALGRTRQATWERYHNRQMEG